MDPLRSRADRRRSRLPRTRGDGPDRNRGNAGGLPASPHTRGWTLPCQPPGPYPDGFPAHAGMDPRYIWQSRAATGLPRTRGDGPSASAATTRARPASPHTRGWTRARAGRPGRARGFPAHAGMDLGRGESDIGETRLPRTRGDGPRSTGGLGTKHRASPHTRGWTQTQRHQRHQGLRLEGFPAHAGMDLSHRATRHGPPGLPRTRGDGPCSSCGMW